MSSITVVKLKRKGEPVKNAPIVLEMYTTPTRYLRDEVDLADVNELEIKYPDDEYSYYTVLTAEKLEEIIAFYDKEVKELESSITAALKERSILEARSWKVKSPAVYDRIMEQHEMNEGSYTYYKEELENTEYLREQWYAVKRLINLNTDFNRESDFELVYCSN